MKPTRRNLLQAATAAIAGGWLTRVAHVLARQAEAREQREDPARPQSLIVLWLAGGPSQLETFDPHPGREIAGGTAAIDTRAPGVQLAAGYERLAEQMQHVCLIRSLVSKEGDHARASLLAKTGYPPNATVAFPSVGAICCHQLPRGGAEIPRHVSILADASAGRGGFLGPEYDAFMLGDPAAPVPDVQARVSLPRMRHRLADVEVVDRAFLRGREPWSGAVAQRQSLAQARRMMESSQLAAFSLDDEPRATRERYGDTAFGRGCLAARRLTEVGVRCVEVTLGGWDTHANNHELHRGLAETLDPALAALLGDLAERDRLSTTLIACLGEFGRSPKINPVGGRDHWTHGFSALLAGGRVGGSGARGRGVRGGAVVGATDPEGGREVVDPRTLPDLHATLLTALGIDPLDEVLAPGGRPVKLSEGTPIEAALAETT